VGLEHQGRGLGKELRSAVLHLAFSGLGAEQAVTGAFADNARSLGVTRALGYSLNGESRTVRRGEQARLLHYTLDAATWAETRRDDVTIEGLDACRPLFGI
jgi:RimJ/RimL family protein N-acetyltransferase